MRTSKWRMLLALLFSFALVAAACSGDDEDADDVETDEGGETTDDTEAEDADADDDADDEAGSGDGLVVTVSGPENTELDTGAITAAFEPFTAETGITVEYTGSRDFSDTVGVQVEAGTSTDILYLPQPGKLADFARDGFLVPLPEEVETAATTNWSADWTTFGTVDDTAYGVPVKADLKSLVWYQPAVFAEKGYEVPATWDDFKALVTTMIENGDTPLCVGIESGGATGWAFTDWVEDIMLRLHGADVYDQWVNHEIPFNDERVVEVMDEILGLWNTEGAVFASGGTIATTPFAENAQPLVDQDCLMHRQANFFAGNFPEGTPANDGSEGAVNAFYLPPAGDERPLLVAGVLAAAVNDRPEVWQVMEYMTTAEYANARQAAQVEALDGATSGFLSAVNGWDESNLNDLEKSFLEIFAQAEVSRFDGSDLMPAAVGSGSFWTEGTAAVNGDKTVQEAADAIEASWP